MRSAFFAVAVLLSACSSAGPPIAIPSASPTASAVVIPATATPAPTDSVASPTSRPTPTPITELSQVFRPLATAWRPTGPTLVVGRYSDAGETTLVAIAIGTSGRLGSPTPFVTLAPGSWALRPDAGAVVIGVGAGGGRLAFWDVRSGEARWLTTPDAGGGSPVWSKDGNLIYYASSGDDGKPGIFQIGADGSGRKPLFTHERFGQLEGLTPDGGGIVWSRGQAGGSVDIFDLATGVNREIANNALVSSWRARQPRLLLSVGWCCAGGPGASLVAWDDRAMTSTVVAARGPNGEPGWGMAAWEPDGPRIAAVRYTSASRTGEVVILDPRTGAVSSLDGAKGSIGRLFWLPEGIIVSVASAPPSGSKLRLIPVSGGPAVELYDDAGYVQRVEVMR